MMCYTCSKKMIWLAVALAVAWFGGTWLAACDWFWLRFWFAGTGCQGIRATPVSWPPCLLVISSAEILNFQLGTSCVCGAVVKTMKMQLVGSLSRAGSYIARLSGAHDTMTMVSEDLMSHPYLCRCACAHLWVSLKFLFFFLIFIYLFIYLFLAVLGLRFCARAFSSCGNWGPLFIAVRGPLTVAASLVAEHRLQTCRLSSCGSRA